MSKRKSTFTRFAIALVVGLIICFAFVLPSLKLSAKIYQTENTFLNTDFDFLIKSTGEDQANELMQNQDVKSLLPYYESLLVIHSGGKEHLKTVVELTSFSGLSITPFSETMLLEGALPTKSNELIIDQRLKRDLNLSLSDKLQIEIGRNSERVEFSVVAIVENSYFFKSGVAVIVYDGIQKEIIDSGSYLRQYSGAYLKANNYQAVKDILSDYKPMGNAPRLDEYNSEDEYNIALNSFLSRDHSRYVINIAELAENTASELDAERSSLDSNVIIASIILAVVILLSEGILAVLNHKILLKNLNNGAGSLKALLPNILTCALSAIIIISSLFIALPLGNSDFFTPQKPILLRLLILIITVLASYLLALLGYGYYIFYMNNRSAKSKKKTDKKKAKKVSKAKKEIVGTNKTRSLTEEEKDTKSNSKDQKEKDASSKE